MKFVKLALIGFFSFLFLNVHPTHASGLQVFSCQVISNGSTEWPYGPLQFIIRNGKFLISANGKLGRGLLKMGPYTIIGPFDLENRLYGHIASPTGDYASFQYICPKM